MGLVSLKMEARGSGPQAIQLSAYRVCACVCACVCVFVCEVDGHTWIGMLISSHNNNQHECMVVNMVLSACRA